VTVDERAKEFVREMRGVVSFGKDSQLGHMIWSAIERAFKMGYAAGSEDAGKPARRGNDQP
jgi:hypothetical protein